MAAGITDDIFVSVLGFRRKGDRHWSAVALEMDLWGYGSTAEKAIDDLKQLVIMQISFACHKEQTSQIDRPADPQYWETFRAIHAESLRRAADTTKRRPARRYYAQVFHPQPLVKGASDYQLDAQAS